MCEVWWGGWSGGGGHELKRERGRWSRWFDERCGVVGDSGRGKGSLSDPGRFETSRCIRRRETSKSQAKPLRPPVFLSQLTSYSVKLKLGNEEFSLVINSLITLLVVSPIKYCTMLERSLIPQIRFY